MEGIVMSNSYDVAYQLEKTIRDSNEYQQLKESYEAIDKDPSTKKMFDDLREMQMKLQQQQMLGEQISEEEVEKAQNLFQLSQQSPLISNLLAAEQRVNVLIQDVNKIISKPLEDLYGTQEEQQ
jgi:cell fate (sporulation/competence/biofilm development) regulator YlbF (YheA/YmcA/DUF963 family)